MTRLLRNRWGEDAQASHSGGLEKVVDQGTAADGALLVLVYEHAGGLRGRASVGPLIIDARQELADAVDEAPLRASMDHNAVSGRQALTGELVVT